MKNAARQGGGTCGESMKGVVMMDKPKSLYLVKNSSGRTLHVWAASGNQAKRIFCREYGIRPGDDWCGLPDLTARKLKPEEVKAWEAQAEADRATLVFIKGMLEIGAKVCAEGGHGGLPAGAQDAGRPGEGRGKRDRRR